MSDSVPQELIAFSAALMWPFVSQNAPVEPGTWGRIDYGDTKLKNYFHSHVQDVLFRHENVQVYQWRDLSPEAYLEVHFNPSDGVPEFRCRLAVSEILVHRFAEDPRSISARPTINPLCILSIFVRQGPGLSLKDALKVLWAARLLHRAFDEESGEPEKYPTSIRLSLDGRTVLETTFPKLGWDFQKRGVRRWSRHPVDLAQGNAISSPPPARSFVKDLVQDFGLQDTASIHDERMFTMGLYALPEGCDVSDRMLSRLLWLEPSNRCPSQDDYSGEPEFARRALQQCAYDRWAHRGARFAFSRFSAVAVGRGENFATKILEDFEGPYHLMSILGLYYLSALLRFDLLVSQATQNMLKEGGRVEESKFRIIRNEFLKFTNLYWFSELTNHDQGIEMFDLQRKALRLDQRYSEVREEIREADELLGLTSREDAEAAEQRLSRLVALLGFLAVMTGIWAMNLGDYMVPGGVLLTVATAIATWRILVRSRSKD